MPDTNKPDSPDQPWWEKPRPAHPLIGFTSRELLDHRAHVVEDIRYWQSGRLPRSPLWADSEDAVFILCGLRHQLAELNHELWQRKYLCVRVEYDGVELSYSQEMRGPRS